MSEISEFAKEILFGQSLAQKLIVLPSAKVCDTRPGPAIEVPRFPGRPQFLQANRRIQTEKKEFPKPHELKSESKRGEVLHYFANHELLAMEIMALVLLRFPDAPSAFRLGIVQTIQEEQSHLKLYLERMQELGVEFGTLPVNHYFWNCMKEMRSPLDFVTQMSLSFEQANLDFSLFYRDAVLHVGDQKTGAILDRVYREEIGHVKHGLLWFNRWREDSRNSQENEWQAYQRLLPPPMTPGRAKGMGFSAEARRQAGFSEIYIQELEVCSGSKGRPPVLWSYNPLCDAEIVRGKPGLSPSKTVQKLTDDLEHIPLFLASASDCVEVSQRPPLEWIQSLNAVGFKCPEFIERKSGTITVESPLHKRYEKWAGVEPWGWSPSTFGRYKPLASQLVKAAGARGLWHQSLLETQNFADTGLGDLFSKAWSVEFLKSWFESTDPFESASFEFLGSHTVGSAVHSFDAAIIEINRLLERGPVLLKAPWGTSGTQNRKVLKKSEIEESNSAASLRGWIKTILKTQKSLVIEPFLDRVCDLSIQMDIQDQGVKLLEVRRFLTGNRLQYQGTLLNQKLVGMPSEVQRFFSSVLGPWQEMLRALGEALRLANYRGPAGVDALIFREVKNGKEVLRLKPLVELNPRWTMGRVALALEEHVAPGTPAAWIFITRQDLERNGFSTFDKFAAEMTRQWPLKTAPVAGGVRISEGALWTNPPSRAREVLTALCTGDAARHILELKFGR